ncbi:hypothetical protein C8A03DRAFT_34483 [Achaetomium macrosporum]|uniref:RING-type domain-containing protein n=1 Tax=Achaetomium macrosporum TaxID=79813 RepID=A0AAN7HBM2_9PEZI|nr:hypothetical protein C8A03DRAFT_34483 [Achaetomium macrosporum]
MCIKLTRHFHSTRFFDREEITSQELRHQRCLDDLDEREEVYEHEACPDCSGEMPHPRLSPYSATAMTSQPFTGKWVYGVLAHAEGVDPASVVSVYAQNLATWLFAYMHADGSSSSLGAKDVLREALEQDDNARAEAELHHRVVSLVSEQICQEHPGHGSVWRVCAEQLTPCETEELDNVVEVEREGETEPRVLLFGPFAECECVPTHDPWLNNMALHIRRTVATGLQQGITDPERNILELDNQELERTFAIAAQLHKALTKRYAPVLGSLRSLEVLSVYDHILAHRESTLEEDRSWMVRLLRSDLLWKRTADPEKEAERLDARASLVRWVTFLLARDPGLSLDRARRIQAVFIAKVVKHDPAGERHSLRDDNLDRLDACRRLAHVANRHAARTPQWAAARLDRFTRAEYTQYMRREWTKWQQRDRDRAKTVELNVVEADGAQLETLRERGEAVCAICLEPFDEHTTAPGFDRPVQNRRCAKRGCSHWCGRACLVKFGRTRQGGNYLAAPHPRCPICRTEFRFPEEEESQ